MSEEKPKIEIDFKEGEVPEGFVVNPKAELPEERKHTNPAEADAYIKELEDDIGKAA